LIDLPKADRALNDLAEGLYTTGRYDFIIRRPLADAVRTILLDLGLDPRRTGETFPPPDPPPRMTGAP
jgi:hypothetical protein